MTLEERVHFYQTLDADKFAGMMLQSEMVGKYLDRQMLGGIWNRAVEKAINADETWRGVLAFWFGAGMVEGYIQAYMDVWEMQWVAGLVDQALRPPFGKAR